MKCDWGGCASEDAVVWHTHVRPLGYGSRNERVVNPPRPFCAACSRLDLDWAASINAKADRGEKHGPSSMHAGQPIKPVEIIVDPLVATPAPTEATGRVTIGPSRKEAA